ncbi:hypothetical protein MBLNU230_g5575t1 [Neophaeotheca triangularis]
MALPSRGLCLRCLGRAAPSETSSSTVAVSHRAAFSTSQPYQANPPKAKNATASGARKGKSLRLAKNTRASTGRPPAPGERKALRKRVVLSNVNALEVQGLQDFNPENAAKLGEFRGGVLGFDDATVDSLKALDGFKPTQGWSMFRRPATVVREATVELAQKLEAVQKDKSTVRRVVTGERGSGKSVLQLQGMAMAYQKGWIVLHIPEGKDLTTNQTAYEPSPDDPNIYLQPNYASQLLMNITKANYNLLNGLRISKQHSLPIPIQANISLARFAELGARDPDLAVPIWRALLEELTTPDSSEGQGQQRPPLYVSLDGFDHVMRTSLYMNAEAKNIHAHDLSLVRDFIQFLTGERKLPNGGAVVAALSQSNRAAAASLDHCLEKQLRLQAGDQGAQAMKWDPYVPADEKVVKVMQSAGLEVQELRGLSKEEARGVMEYYAQSGLLRTNVTQGLVSERWTLAGGGVVGELERGSVGMRF